MKTPKIAAILLFTLLVFSSCASESKEMEVYNEVASKTVDVNYSGFEADVLDKVNDYRISIGLNPLAVNDLASVEASSHTNYMIEMGTISHDNFAERQEYLVNNANAKKVGENVAFGYSTAEEVLEAWLHSKSHRDLIENPTYTHFGISVNSSKSGKNYFTQIFIKR